MEFSTSMGFFNVEFVDFGESWHALFIPVFFMYRQSISQFKANTHGTTDIFERNSNKTRAYSLVIRIALVFLILKVCSLESFLTKYVFEVSKAKDTKKFLVNSINSFFLGYMFAGGPYDLILSKLENTNLFKSLIQ